MAASKGVIRVHRRDRMIIFSAEGQATMALGLPLRQCAEQGLDGGATSIRVDLRHCTYMDSTFLGTLLALKRAVDRRGEGDFALVAPSPQCDRILRQMALAGAFPLVAVDEPPAPDWPEVTGEPAEADAFQRNVYQAHCELASLAGPAGERFQSVVRTLAREMGDE